MISSERLAGLKTEGEKKVARLLLAVDLVKDLNSAVEFAGAIGDFLGKPIKAEVEESGKKIDVTINTECGELRMSFGPESFKLSFSDKARVEKTCDANSPVQKVQLRGPFLLFELKDKRTVRAVKEYGTISIDYFAFDLYPI